MVSKSWVVIELNSKGEEKFEEGTLASSLRRDLGVDEDFEIFIPAISFTRNHRKETITLIEGYVFVDSSLPDSNYFKLESRPYVEQVMTLKGRSDVRELSVVPDVEIVKMRDLLREMVNQDVSVGQWVDVRGGRYRNIKGEILHVEDGQAVIHVALRSLEFFLYLPLVFLTPRYGGEEDFVVDLDRSFPTREQWVPHILSWFLISDHRTRKLPVNLLLKEVLLLGGGIPGSLPVGWNELSLYSSFQEAVTSHEAFYCDGSGNVSLTSHGISLMEKLSDPPHEDVMVPFVNTAMVRLVEHTPHLWTSEELILDRALALMGLNPIQPGTPPTWTSEILRRRVLDCLHGLRSLNRVLSSDSINAPEGGMYWALTSTGVVEAKKSSRMYMDLVPLWEPLF